MTWSGFEDCKEKNLTTMWIFKGENFHTAFIYEIINPVL